MIKIRFKPYPYQLEGLRYCLEHHYCIIGDEMGLGKTITSLLVSLKEGLPTLIICPAFLKFNWRKEIINLSSIPKKILLINKSSDIKNPKGHDFVIVNYDLLKNCEELFSWAKIIIADEAHYLKTFDSNRSLIFHKFVYEYCPERLLLLSGTPIKNRVSEWYSLIRLCSYNPKNTSGIDINSQFKSIYHFLHHYTYERRFYVAGREVTKYEGIKDIEGIRNLLKDKYIRRKADEVISLPDCIRITTQVSYKENKDLEEAWLVFNGEAKSVKTVGELSSIKRMSAINKADFTAKYCENILIETGKVVVFSDHVEPCRNIAESIIKLGYSAEVITGEVSIQNRHSLVEKFQNSDLNALVCSIGAASSGLTLTASRDVVFNDLSYVPADNSQAEKRIHRIGQKNSCRIHIITGSVQDDKISKMIIEKMKVIREVT